MRSAAVQLVLLADSGEEKKAGPLALAIILVLFIACYFLFRSMTRHLRKVRTQFPVGSTVEPPAAVAERPEAGGSSAAPVDAGSGGSSAAPVDAPADAADNLTGSRDPADSRPPARPPEPSPPTS
jgi:hypothetical protein